MNSQRCPNPPEPAYSRRVLARLALSQACYETADLAAVGVPTVCDEFSTPDEYVRHAARLLASAHEALSRAVVYARETGGSWAEIAYALNLSSKQARTRFISAVETWNDEAHPPPAETMATLDKWCARHIERSSGAHYYARLDGIEDRMVSDNLQIPDNNDRAP